MHANDHMSSKEDHLEYLRQALELARKSPPKSTNFRVGAVLVSNPQRQGSIPAVLSTGYTLELPGNTHAEECAITKLASQHGVPFNQLNTILTPDKNATLYTTLEPCGKRLSGRPPCVGHIISTRGDALEREDSNDNSGGIRKVIFGAKEPGTFVHESQSCRMMDDAGLEWEYVEGLQEEILKVAREGHESSASHGTNLDDITEEEKQRQVCLPKNSKKRMMEVSPPS